MNKSLSVVSHGVYPGEFLRVSVGYLRNSLLFSGGGFQEEAAALVSVASLSRRKRLELHRLLTKLAAHLTHGLRLQTYTQTHRQTYQ